MPAKNCWLLPVPSPPARAQRSRARSAGARAPKRPAAGVTLRTLVEQGVLVAGEGVISMEYKGQQTTASLAEDGRIQWRGAPPHGYRGPQAHVRARRSWGRLGRRWPAADPGLHGQGRWRCSKP